MKKVDRLLAFLAFNKRIMLQFTKIKNIRYFYLLFYGFTPNKGNLYDFKKYGYKNYVNDFKRYLNNTFINYNNKDLFRDKYTNFIFLSQFTNHLVPLLGLIDKSRCYLLDTEQDLRTVLDTHPKVIIKPRKSWGGNGVSVIENKNQNYYLDGKQVDIPEQLFKGFDDYLMVPFVQQDNYAENINPNALNTIRLITCIWEDKVETIGACHRFGSKTTGCY